MRGRGGRPPLTTVLNWHIATPVDRARWPAVKYFEHGHAPGGARHLGGVRAIPRRTAAPAGGLSTAVALPGAVRVRVGQRRRILEVRGAWSHARLRCRSPDGVPRPSRPVVPDLPVHSPGTSRCTDECPRTRPGACAGRSRYRPCRIHPGRDDRALHRGHEASIRPAAMAPTGSIRSRRCWQPPGSPHHRIEPPASRRSAVRPTPTITTPGCPDIPVSGWCASASGDRR